MANWLKSSLHGATQSGDTGVSCGHGLKLVASQVSHGYNTWVCLLVVDESQYACSVLARLDHMGVPGARVCHTA